LNKKRRRWSTGLFVLFLVAMAFLIFISASSLYLGYNLYMGGDEGYIMYLVTGIFGLILAVYGVNQMKRRIVVIRPIEFNVVTVTECEKCGFRNIRKFDPGDYILKTYGNCPKCEGLMLITSIYHEDKRKTGFL